MVNSTNNTSAQKLKLYSNHISYIADGGGIRNIMGITIFFLKNLT